MVRQGMLVTVIVLLLAGLLFTFTNIIFTVLNIAHNPVSSLMGVDGLVVWNLAAGLLYLLVVILWGAEYSLKMRTSAANRLIGEVVQSRRRPLLGPSPG